MLQSGIHHIDQMDGIEFEDYLEALFGSQGYVVKRTPISHDYGADLILRKQSQSIAVQAKRYDTAVGLGAVQEDGDASDCDVGGHQRVQDDLPPGQVPQPVALWSRSREPPRDEAYQQGARVSATFRTRRVVWLS